MVKEVKANVGFMDQEEEDDFIKVPSSSMCRGMEEKDEEEGGALIKQKRISKEGGGGPEKENKQEARRETKVMLTEIDDRKTREKGKCQFDQQWLQVSDRVSDGAHDTEAPKHLRLTVASEASYRGSYHFPENHTDAQRGLRFNTVTC